MWPLLLYGVGLYFLHNTPRICLAKHLYIKLIAPNFLLISFYTMYGLDLFDCLLALTAIVWVLLVGRRLRLGTRSNLPPGPWKLPLIGNIHQLVGDLPHRAMSDLAKTYGPIMHLQLGEVSHVIVSSPDMAKEVMKTHDIIFASRPETAVSKLLSYDSTNIAFSPYGEYWRQLRKICTLELLSARRVRSFRSIRETESLNLMKSIALNERKTINLTKMVFSSTHCVISKAAFGRKNEDQEDFKNLMTQVFKLGAGINIADLYPSFKFLHSISGVKPTLERLHSQVDKILEKIITAHRIRNLQENLDDEPEDSKDLVDVLLKYQDADAEFHLTNENIKAVILDIFAAGGEPSATTIDWAMSEMIRNPSILKRAQEEVRQAFGSGGCLHEEKLDNLKYMRSIIKETLRLHPPVPLLLPRQNSRKVKINGYEIPEKTKVFVNAWAISRDPMYWEDPECFKPERFLDSLIENKGTHLEYIPFGAGRRICPGIAFAWPSIVLPIAQFLYYFDWVLPSGMKHEDVDMKEVFALSVRRNDDLYLIPSIHNPLPLS